jgi:peptidoglycan hydrolase-like protein with peptidoglycan-binding domain
MKRLCSLVAALATTLALVLGLVVAAAPADAAGRPRVEKAQRALNHLGCRAGPADGDLGQWTRSAVIRFQSRHHLPQSGRLTRETRRRLYADDALRCDQRPVPDGSGRGRRIVISQGQNWVWLVGAGGGIAAQGGIVDNPAELHRGSYATGSYCGRTARIRKNSTTSNQVWLDNFVRFAPCGIGFHRIPTYKSNGAQMHADWLLGTNLTESHGCIRLTREMSVRIWKFTARRTSVHVV